MKPPAFKTQAEADEWLDRAGLFQEAIMGTTQQWRAEDDSIIGYSTSSLPRGGFCSFRFRIVHDDNTEVLFVKHHSMRRAARQRAVVLYKKYSPKFARKHPDFA